MQVHLIATYNCAHAHAQVPRLCRSSLYIFAFSHDLLMLSDKLKFDLLSGASDPVALFISLEGMKTTLPERGNGVHKNGLPRVLTAWQRHSDEIRV